MKSFIIICHLIVLNVVFIAVMATAPAHDDCAVGQYRCKHTTLVCVRVEDICNGKADCPDGDDEHHSYCNGTHSEPNGYNPGGNFVNVGNRYVYEVDSYVDKNTAKLVHNELQESNDDEEWKRWHNNGCGAGHYLCNGTLNICLTIDSICDGAQDCPYGDDEDWNICKNWPQKTQSRPYSSETMGGNVEIQANSESNGAPIKGLEDNYSGTGFMFHVNNLVIYNSEVKMFNQNSDNVGNGGSKLNKK